MVPLTKILFSFSACLIISSQLHADTAIADKIYTDTAGNNSRVKLVVTRERADELLAKMPATDPWVRKPDGSSLAWGEAATLRTLLNLYEATDDVKYLAELASRGDRLLSHRDDRRGVVDGSGKSRPAWSMALKYVVAEGTLNDESGRKVLSIKSTPSAYNDSTKVQVIAGKNGLFTLHATNGHYKRYETFSDVSLDPAHSRFVERIVNDPMSPYSTKAGTYSDTPSNLIRVRVSTPAILPAQIMTLQSVPLAYMGYIGIIYTPMLKFAEIVKANNELKELVPAADRFIRAAEESYADASERLWRNGPKKGEGHYLTCEKGESFPADNVGAPINFLAMHTCAELSLYRLTGKKEYLERSEKMSRLLKNRLKHDAAADLYTWTYWYEPMTTTGWTPKDNLSSNVKYFKGSYNIEDTSHGTLDIAMVMAANQQGIVFSDQDAERFTNTFLKNVIMPDRSGLRRTVDGRGGEHTPYFNALHGWLELAAKNPEVYQAIRQAYINKGEENLAFCAALLKWERNLTK